MIDSLKQIKNRIRSIDNTRKVMHAMEMISIAKLKISENKLLITRPYFLKLEKLLQDILTNIIGAEHSFLGKPKATDKVALCIITSDTGLCSDYNRNIIRLAEEFINKYGNEKISLITVGKKGFTYFKKKGANIVNKFIELKSNYSDVTSDQILKTLTDIFLSGEACEIYLAYTYFKSLSKHIPTIEKILNIDSNVSTERIEYIIEPDTLGILAELIPLYLSYKVKIAFLNAFMSEHASRMIAMAEATNNAKELLQDLILSRNKLRQANITKEIIELVSSAEVVR
jgi:F-type H+-transporting ATPase subunit gamma